MTRPATFGHRAIHCILEWACMLCKCQILGFFPPGWLASPGTFKINKAKMMLFISFCHTVIITEFRALPWLMSHGLWALPLGSALALCLRIAATSSPWQLWDHARACSCQNSILLWGWQTLSGCKIIQAKMPASVSSLFQTSISLTELVHRGTGAYLGEQAPDTSIRHFSKTCK